MKIEDANLLAVLRGIPGWAAVEGRLDDPVGDDELALMEANMEEEHQRALQVDVNALPGDSMPTTNASPRRALTSPSAKSVTRATTKISIRIKTDVLAALKKKAMNRPTGYQRLINEILRIATQAEREAKRTARVGPT